MTNKNMSVDIYFINNLFTLSDNVIILSPLHSTVTSVFFVDILFYFTRRFILRNTLLLIIERVYGFFTCSSDGVFEQRL